MRTGTTLLELVVALLLLGVLVGLSLPPVARLRDRVSVLEARERFVALVRETRSVAIERGGARLFLDAENTTAWLVAGGDTIRRDQWTTAGRRSVRITARLGGAALPFGPAGLGQFTSTTITFIRGTEEAAAVVSSYGRVRRR